MQATDILAILTIGAMLGAGGQILRVFIGWKKRFQEAGGNAAKFKEGFSAPRMIISILMGAVAGMLAILTKDGGLSAEATFSSDFLIAVMGAGYAGSDFIEGVFSQKRPIG